jgi:hypothetical protein
MNNGVVATRDEVLQTINETEFFDLWIEKHPVL